MQLAVNALNTSNGLTGGSLSLRPLGLLVAWRASVRAEHALSAAVVAAARSAGDGLDVAVASIVGAGILNASPATESEPGSGNRPIV